MADEAGREYGNQVAGIIAADPRNSSWTPEQLVELFIKNRRQPLSASELEPIEREQLARMFQKRADDLAALDAVLTEPVDDFPLEIEVADVVDDNGSPRYRLWAGNFGWAYLMAADSLACIAFTSQHDIEHWSVGQRPVFWAMDRALRRGDHGVRQGLKFDWWEDSRWTAIVGKEGTLYSEPYIRQTFAT